MPEIPHLPFKVLNKASIQITDSIDKTVFHAVRRGIDTGVVQLGKSDAQTDPVKIATLWGSNMPAYLPGVLSKELGKYSNEIDQSRLLYEALLNEEEVEDILDSAPYSKSLGERFQLLSSRFDESDQQEIISVDFDVMDGETLLMEDVWMRVSWLSYHEEDASLRFRFSFGMENFDDVSEDPERQLAAAELSQKIFPESKIITENESLIELLKETLNVDAFNFVERIIYFNAPNGGAQFHHDAEKGHLGVVYAQMTGETLWLALSRPQLIEEIIAFMKIEKNLTELETLFSDKNVFTDFCVSIKDKDLLSTILNDPSNEEISTLLNESTSFFEQMINGGYAYHLTAGDVILLPQESMNECAWHSVFCVGDEAGEALSFAIKSV